MCLTKTYSKYIFFQNPRIPIKLINDVKTNKLLRPTHTNTNDASKSILKTTSIINIVPKKRSESSNANLITIPLSKTMSDTRFRANIKNEKLIPQRKNVGNASSTCNVNEKHVKKEIASKTTIRRESKNLSKCDELSDKQQNKSEKYFNKIDNTSNTKSIASSQESKLKSSTSKIMSSKNTVGNVKSSLDLTQNFHNKTRAKTKAKPKKKITATKSEIFNTDAALPRNSFEDDNFDLADLIEASLKNIRSPRSIFDYDFSCIQQSNATKKDNFISKIRNEIQSTDKLKQLKPSRNSVITNNFSNKMIRGEFLEKLSEKSESFSELSNESIINDRKFIPDRDNKPSLLSEKCTETRKDLQQSLDWKQNVPVPFEDRWEPYSDVNFWNKPLNPKNVDNSEKKSFISRGPSRTSLLKSYQASNSLESKKNVSTHSSKNVK